MSYHGPPVTLAVRPIVLASLVLCLVGLGGSVAFGQTGLLYARPPAVGGIAVNAEGVLTNATSTTRAGWHV